MQTIKNLPVTVYKTREVAASLAAANQAQDPDTEYRVVERADGRFVIALFDDGHPLGAL